MKTLSALFPRLQYPFDYKVHCKPGLIRDMTTSFIDDYSFIPAKKRTAFKLASLDRLTAMWFPDCNDQLIIPFTRLLLWVFIFDDLYAPLPLHELKAAHERLVDILEGSPLRRGENEIFSHFAIARDELAAHITPAWMVRYKADWQYFFEGQQLEKQYSYKATVTYPSVEEYMLLREKVGGTYPYLDLVEIGTGLILPEEILLHPAIQQRRFFVSRLTTWDNDLLSFSKEMMDKEAMNLVAVIRHELGCSLEKAFATALDMRNGMVDAYLELRAELPDFGIYQEKVEQYVLNLEWMISGHLEWYRDNPRYL